MSTDSELSVVRKGKHFSGKVGTMTHDYVRHGTTTLFAALNVLDGAVLGRCMQRHATTSSSVSWAPSGRRYRPASWSMSSLKLRHPQAPQGDQLGSKQHQHWTFHYTPTTGSRLNAIEEACFLAMTR